MAVLLLQTKMPALFLMLWTATANFACFQYHRSISLHKLPQFRNVVQQLLEILVRDLVGQAWNQCLGFFSRFAAEAP